MYANQDDIVKTWNLKINNNGFNTYFTTFSSYVSCPFYICDSYIQYSTYTPKILLNYVNILQNLKKSEGVSIHYVKYLVRSIMSFLYNIKYTESNKADFVLASKRLVHKSLNRDNSCVKLLSAIVHIKIKNTKYHTV